MRHKSIILTLLAVILLGGRLSAQSLTFADLNVI